MKYLWNVVSKLFFWKGTRHMDKTYSPTEIEKKWRETWERSGAYNATEIAEGRKNFTIVLPPPNANASLHAGHAMFVVQDILVRYHRMRGDNAVWIPGTDHAGFETQYVFEKALSKQGKSRFDFNRQDFYEAVYGFVKDNSGLIEEQLKSLGFSLDWSRKSFTLDEHVVRLVYDTFEKMYADGLIYRDNYIVNYCTHCGTTFSELEINYIDRVDPLYYMKYGPFVLATVRPETKFGDTAIAVNPNDARYKDYIGKEIEVEGLLGKFMMKVIADEFVDPEFGTGVVKVTPAHDPNDFAMGRRHGLEVRKVIDLNGRLNAHAGEFGGMKVKEARAKVVEALLERGLMEKVEENYTHRVAVCYKCGRDIEPMVLPNWFVKMKPLAERAKLAAEKKYVQFYPARFEDEFYRWMDAIKDWPISRQVVWGIRIPAWYDVAKNPNLHVTFLNKASENVTGKIDELLKAYDFEEIREGLQSLTAENDAVFVIADKSPEDGNLYLPETDTFDTWFSSGQWPLAVLHYPDSEDFQRLYPTAVLDTMWDILFFWVARMIMLGIYVTEKDGRGLEDAVPFRQVLLHSRVVDAKGVKMSKSKGNVVNPLDLTAKYGTDAFRMSLIAGSALGNDVPMAEEKVKGYRNFANKVWNSARFVLEFKPEGIKGIEIDERFYKYSIFNDNWILINHNLADFGNDWEIDQSEDSRAVLEKLDELKELVEDALYKYRFSDAAVAIYEFYWHEFCDKYIEYAKNRREQTQPILEFVLKSSMELLHPFMPFITEEIWQQLPHKGTSISIANS
jgi:valyl-tRNA synthetase